MSGGIDIIGAQINNLQSIDVTLPIGSATMVVGVSGSGKSSLLEDTLAAEATARMHRYLGIRQAHLADRDVAAFLGPLPACIHFSQGAFRASVRTTVATSSGLLALLRRYFRRCGQPWSREVNTWVPPPSPDSYGDWIRKQYSGPLSVWVVVARWVRTDGFKEAQQLLRHGLSTAIVRSDMDTGARREKGRTVEIAKFKPLSLKGRHLIEVEIGRCRETDSPQLSAFLDKAFAIGGDVIVTFDKGTDLAAELHSARGVLLDSAHHWVHAAVARPYAPASDSLLSFNSPENPLSGACRACQGLGRARSVNIERLVSRPDRSLEGGAFSLWTEKNYRYVNIQHGTIEGLRGFRGFSPDLAWRHLGVEARNLVLYGSSGEALPEIDLKTGRPMGKPRKFPGFVPEILRRATGSGAAARALDSLVHEGPCRECAGTRWSRAARALRLDRWDLPTLLGLSFDELTEVAAPGGALAMSLPKVAKSLAPALRHAALAFVTAGLGHLSCARGMTSLSEGESRRSRLAMLLRARGRGLGLLLDEPARGLHEEDVARLAVALHELKQRHTLIINEHRLSLASAADRVLEIGPGAGEHGGRIVGFGHPGEILASDRWPKITREKIAPPTRGSWLTVTGANLHTLAGITCRIPLGRFVCVTGVSGSGKSTFVRGILLPALMQALPGSVDCEGFSWPGGSWKRLQGFQKIRSVLALEPRTPSAQRRSNVATLLGLSEDIRRNFGKSPAARSTGLAATDFGWNAGRGRCLTCLGIGEVEDTGQWVTCPHCGGTRFGEEVLGVRIAGLNVADLLDLSIEDLHDHSFVKQAGWQALTEQLIALDLGYLTLGRRVDRLSGGEHQRLRVARTLCGAPPEGLFLVLDEPSAGLHPQDVARLLEVLDRVVAGGRNTVVLVEHNLDLIRNADWVVDFGPGGGPAGGQIIDQGPLSEITGSDTPTGRVLRAGIKLTRTHHRVIKQAGPQRASEPLLHDGRRWLRQVLGEEASEDDLDAADFAKMAIVFDATPCRPHEVAGLDVEIARLLLDEAKNCNSQLGDFVQAWQRAPDAQLLIHPLLEELRVWGPHMPDSVLKEAGLRLQRMELHSNLATEGLEPMDLWATGKRFQPSGESPEERMRCIRDALGVGGGYLALKDGNDHILACFQRRHMALAVPAVAPLSPNSAWLVRSRTMGGCPCCKGAGAVPIFAEKLIIGIASANPTSEDFLHPAAMAVLRGIRRNMLLPFLKRMGAEGLWSSEKSYSQLSEDERILLMHGFWRRPGPGSFLKSARTNPNEVGSWLRWDGLYRAVMGEVDRSVDHTWRERVKSSATESTCPLCTGTGLQWHARAVLLGPRSYFDLVRSGSVGDLAESLSAMVLISQRAALMRDRLLHCLEPLVDNIPEAMLRVPLKDSEMLRAVFERTVRSLTNFNVTE